MKRIRFSDTSPVQVLANPATKTAPIAETDSFDDRRHCRDCQHLVNAWCRIDQYKPIDTIPRRCQNFKESV